MFLKISQNSQEAPELKSLLIKVAGLRPFPVSFVKFLRTPFLKNASGQLLLKLKLSLKKKSSLHFRIKVSMFKNQVYISKSIYFFRIRKQDSTLKFLD